jgi:hypothetical protein
VQLLHWDSTASGLHRAHPMTSAAPLNWIVIAASSAAGLAVLALRSTGDIEDRSAFVALSAILLSFLAAQTAILRRAHPERWLLNPVVLASFVTFVMGYGLTNVVFLLPDEELQNLGQNPGVSPAMVSMVFLALMAAVAMWSGYWSPIAAFLSAPPIAAAFQARLVPREPRLRTLTIPTLVIVATAARLIQVKLGAFGYTSNVDRLVELANLTTYLTLVAGLGKLALVLSALRAYQPQCTKGVRTALVIVLVLEVMWGMLSGFKSAVVLPFVIVGLCYYLAKGSLPRQWIIIAVISVIAAYAIIEPFRAERNRDAAELGTGVGEIASMVLRSAEERPAQQSDRSPLALTVACRLNLTNAGSTGLEYAGAGALTDQDPAFLDNILLSPAYAWVPRLLWPNKPLGTLGLWYNQVVMGRPHDSAEAMGPVTYLYFAGGLPAVTLGFLLVGLLQRLAIFLLQPWNSLPGGVVFLALLSRLATIDSSFDGFLISLFREVPLLLLLQFLLFCSSAQPSRSALLGPTPN